MRLSPAALAILRSPAFAHVALIDEHGRPHVTPMWIDVEGDESIVINTAEGRVKARAFAVGTVVAISALDPSTPYSYVMVRGTVVERTHEGAQDVIERLAEKYRGVRAFDSRGKQRVTVRIRPDHVVAHDV